MSKSKVFQYVVLWHPEEGSEESSHIVVQPTTVLAKSEKTVGLIAAKEIPEKYADKLDELEISIRQF